jgi:hypothetical protein
MKYMKLAAMLLLAQSATLVAMGQSDSDLSALMSFLPQGKLTYLQSNNPELVSEMAYINRHGYYISDMEGQKDVSDLPDALLVPAMYENALPLSEQLITSGNFNLLAYQFPLRHEDHSYYRIGQSDKVLVILPRKLAQENLGKATITEQK